MADANETEGARLFAERQQRIADAIALRKPDKVPVFLYTTFWIARYAGMTCREAMFEPDRLVEATRRAVLEFQPDAYAPPAALGPAMKAIDYRLLRLPGEEGLSDDVTFQFLDKEYMTAEEYDDYLLDPTGFYLHTYLPRAAGAYEPMKKLPDFPALFYTRIPLAVRAYADPELSAGLEALIEAGRDLRKSGGKIGALIDELAGLGYPIGTACSGGAPYDLFADYLRGSKGAMLDMYRRPDKLLAAMDKAARFIPRGMIAAARNTACNIAFIPLHWGLDGFMSPKQFETFYWPQLRQVVMTLIDAGLNPCLLWEGECDSRLEIIKDVPPGKCIYFFEKTDVFKAKKVLGDTVCIRGNVPVSMLNTGTPDQVRDYCKRLIDEVGADGGLIVDGAVGIPDEAKPENVRAMFETVRDYGVYS